MRGIPARARFRRALQAEHRPGARIAEPDWQERNDRVFRDRLVHMPEQFAEASQRYSSDPRDYLLSSLLRHCVTRRSRTRGWDVERSQFMSSVADGTAELMDKLLACECGIVLRCFQKMEYRDYALQRALIERMLQRGQAFSPYAAVSALSTLAEGYAGSGASQWRTRMEETERLLRRLLAQVRAHMDRFNLGSLARLTNTISRLPCDVGGVLSSVRDSLFNRHIPESDAALWTEEVVHFFANGLSRKGMLDKKLFDFLRERIMESCPGYSVDTLVSLSNAYSKFGSAEAAGYIELFTRLAEEIVTQRHQLTNRHVCVVANAFAMSCLCHEDLLEVIDDSFVFGIDAYDGRQIAMMIHAFNKLGYRSRNNRFIWRKCTEHLDTYSWQGLTMIFHAYTKGEIRDQATTAKFCQRFVQLFDDLERQRSGVAAHGPTGADLPQPTTYVSLVYSLVKGNILQSDELLVHLAKGCLSNLSTYEPDEIANLALAFSRIRNYAMRDGEGTRQELSRLCQEMLEGLTMRLGETRLQFSAFSMAKVVEALGDCAFMQSAQAVLGLVKRNILILDRLSYTHITAIVIHDDDLMSVLNSLKHNKRIRHAQASAPPAAAQHRSV
ncbi:hypothetical protein, conserved [Babesia bigemina]|uniref:RNA-editing substrate-binding complex 6 protein domain-containing protein n=1 Tax=Babesia bigemina TaxID=5866 RepID=A0A061D9U5_BABBI|nr:hypothetical protein, conserved [Babesia bigemina]CDR94510.1 hypothetical protein, conserved [Babesia bigemina]|eukprot:XP_012766696.1 hypothetical protein, conserved [Babesia bigemina]